MSSSTRSVGVPNGFKERLRLLSRLSCCAKFPSKQFLYPYGERTGPLPYHPLLGWQLERLPGSGECLGEISPPPGNLGTEGQCLTQFGLVAFNLPAALSHLKWLLNVCLRRRVAAIQREQKGDCIAHSEFRV